MEQSAVDCAKTLVEKFTGFAERYVYFNLQGWLQYFAFDTIALITLSKRFGLLVTGCDDAGMLAAVYFIL